jgi:RHS repeat-associated protein
LEERKNTETTAAIQYYWGARHRDDLARRDRATTDGGLLDESRYVLMDYYSPASIIDETGNVTERYAFGAFGIRRILAPDFSPRSTSECDFEFSFQGQFLDAENGLLDYGYRYYSPFLGRWLCKDPIAENGGNNLYLFVSNSPLDRTDAFGLWTATKTEEVYAAQPFPKGLKIAAGTVNIPLVYIDAASTQSLQTAQPGAYNALFTIPGFPATPDYLSEINSVGYLGAGFMATFTPDPSYSCCDHWWWEQTKTIGADTSADYTIPGTTTGDFPGNAAGPGGSISFALTLYCGGKGLCRSKQSLATITWSVSWKRDANGGASSVKMTIDGW